jgi:uncharacterized protein YjbI with pentapeptide repeats
VFTRLAMIVLTGMSGRLLRRPRARARRRETAASTVTRSNGESTGETSTGSAQTGTLSPAPTAAQTQSSPPPATVVRPPEEHGRRLRPRARAPLVARIGARSLPLLGVIGMLATAILAAGAVSGELPHIGAVESANVAWATALLTISLWAVYFLWKVPQWQADAWARSGNASPREVFEIENESRGTLGQILSGVAVLTGLIFAWQQLGQTSDNLRVSQEGQITDRFSRAVDQLGSDDLTARLGGIYALERIARDSPRDYGPVMEVLTAFVRQESLLPVSAVATPATSAPSIPLEVKAVLKVIGRRTPAQITAELETGGCLELTGINAVGVDVAGYDLRNTCWDRSDLRGATMLRADLAGTTFVGSALSQANLDSVNASAANFYQADLSGANLSRADLRNANLLAADLSNATLQGTNFGEANILGTNLRNALLLGADLSGANVLNADFTGAVLSGANLASVEGLTAEQIEPAIVDSATQLPPGIDVPPDL